jgi:WD40 repeat protein
MEYRLLLVNGYGEAVMPELRIRTLRQFPGPGGLSVHFRPVRSDMLFESAKAAGQLAYRILSGEGVARNQLWVEYELIGEQTNVVGRSSDLLFALALLTATWKHPDSKYTALAATGTVDNKGNIGSVDSTVRKLSTAVRGFPSGSNAIVFYPSADSASVAGWRASNPLPDHVQLCAVAQIEEVLPFLGYALNKVYLRNPFRGLEHFEFQDHPIFFGRDAEVQEIVSQLLRREAAGVPGILVEGASGSGKSSFLRAGVLPALVDPRSQSDDVRQSLLAQPLHPEVHRAIWRPGLLSQHADEATIAKSIRKCWELLPPLFQPALTAETNTFHALAGWRGAHWPADYRFVWLIDQFEELFSLALDNSLIEAFGTFLRILQRGGVWVMGSIRADAAPSLKQSDALRAVFGANEGQYYLSTLHGPALDDVISRPAAAAGLTFEIDVDGRALDSVLREAAYVESESLPLLAFTLNKLYEVRRGDELTFAAYGALGGLAGSISSTAENVINSADINSRQVVESVFRSLVSVDDVGKAVRRYAPLSELSIDPKRQRMVDHFVKARLCVTDQREGIPVVAFAHDTLLRTLPALTDWLRQEASLIQTRDLALREASLWEKHNNSDHWLAGDYKLAAFKGLIATTITLPDTARQFIERSAQRALRNTRLKRLAMGTIASLAVAATIAGWLATRRQHEAEFQTAETLKAQYRLLTQSAADRLKEGDVSKALAIILEVLRSVPLSRQHDATAVNVFQKSRARDPALTTFAGHADRVHTVAFSPDGTRIVTGSFDQTVRIWDTATGTELKVLAGHSDIVMSAVFSPDASRIVSASVDKTARVWDADSGRLICVIDGHTASVRTAIYTPDGKGILTASGDTTVRLWDASSCAELRTYISGGAKVASASFARDGSRIAAAMGDGTVIVLDARTGTKMLTLKGHTNTVASANFSSDGRRLVTASYDRTIRTWDANTGDLLAAWPAQESSLSTAVYSPDGSRVLSASFDNIVRIWDAQSGKLINSLTGHNSMVWKAVYSADGSSIATASSDGTARTWSAQVESPSSVLPGTGDSLNGIAYSKNGQALAAASSDGTVLVWVPSNTNQFLSLHGHSGAVNSVDFSPDGRNLLTAGDDSTARIWDIELKKSVAVLSASPDKLFYAAYSPDGKRLIVSRGDSLELEIWKVSGALISTLRGHKDHAHVTHFSPDGNYVLTASEDHTARIWNGRTGLQVGMIPNSGAVNSAAYSPDGTEIVTGGDDATARTWNAFSLAPIRTFVGHEDAVTSVAFSPDGRRVVTGSDDRSVRTWNADTGDQVGVFLGHRDSVSAVAYSPDGNHIASASRDGTARVWNTAFSAELPAQIVWGLAARFESLSEVERGQLGLAQEQVNRREFPDPSDCDIAAGSMYDPDRRAQGAEQSAINPDTSLYSCDRQAKAGQSDHIDYLEGRIAVAKADWIGARRYFEAALAHHYRAAGIDLADLMANAKVNMHDSDHAKQLYNQAWSRGLPFAGFRLGQLLEAENASSRGAAFAPVDPALALGWYQRAAKAGEPNALARLAELEAANALTQSTSKGQNALLLKAFGFYARSVERARSEGWPDAAWSAWRYHRASLARHLAREGMMQQVADSYRNILFNSDTRGL